MPVTEKNKTVTAREKGATIGAEEYLKYDTHREALSYYEIFKQRFLHVNSWKKFTGRTGIKFELAGIDGNLVENEEAREGYLIRIDIPAKGSRRGSDFDWVRIELITDEYDPMKDESMFSMRVRSVPEPGFTTSEPTHFLSNESTNTFTLKRIGTEIIASVSGEEGNYPVEPKGFFSRIKDIFLSFFSSPGGTNSLWRIFLKGILDKK